MITTHEQNCFFLEKLTTCQLSILLRHAMSQKLTGGCFVHTWLILSGEICEDLFSIWGPHRQGKLLSHTFQGQPRKLGSSVCLPFEVVYSTSPYHTMGCWAKRVLNGCNFLIVMLDFLLCVLSTYLSRGKFRKCYYRRVILEIFWKP